MHFIETKIAGAFILEIERLEDDRGFFARTFCRREFEAHELKPELVQCSISFNKKRGTLRGMHFHIEPYAENKLVRCTSGAIYDVILDLRSESATFRQWLAVELSAQNRKMIYIPKGLAHGYQTLEDNTEVFYQMSEFFHPESTRAVRWDDPSFKIAWPLPVSVISDKDNSLPLWGV